TMKILANEYYQDNSKDTTWLKDKLKVDVNSPYFKEDLECFLGTLHSIYFYYDRTNQLEIPEAVKVRKIITDVRNFLVKKCLNELSKESKRDTPLIQLYQLFYRKLLFRNSNLPKVNIFTSNYDLYSETALDILGVHYVNGFSGGIKKFFNPTIFNYALAEKMDLSQTKWSVIDNFIYLYKLHGSINWIQDDQDSKLFKVREIQEASLDQITKYEIVMIHPTPLK